MLTFFLRMFSPSPSHFFQPYKCLKAQPQSHLHREAHSSPYFFFFFCRANILFIFFFSLISISWRPTTLQYCSGSCHTLTRISHGKAPISKGQSPNLEAWCRRFFMIWSMQHSYLCLTKPSLSPENQEIFLLSAYLDLFPASFFSVVIRTEVL